MKFDVTDRIMRLKLLMLVNELTAAEVAKHAGLSESLVKKISAGFRNPGPDTICKLETFFSERIFSTPKEWAATRRRNRRRASIR